MAKSGDFYIISSFLKSSDDNHEEEKDKANLKEKSEDIPKEKVKEGEEEETQPKKIDIKWDKSFITNAQAKALGDKRFNYVRFDQLSPEDQEKVNSLYIIQSIGKKYNYLPSHFYYPVTKDGEISFSGSKRILAIPSAKIRDEKYMSGLGYSVRPEWEKTKKVLKDCDNKKTTLHQYLFNYVNQLNTMKKLFDGNNTVANENKDAEIDKISNFLKM